MEHDLNKITAAITREHNYQRKKWGISRHQTAAWLTILRQLLRRAEDGWTTTSGDVAALQEILKIAATAYKALEQENAVPAHLGSYGLSTMNYREVGAWLTVLNHQLHLATALVYLPQEEDRAREHISNVYIWACACIYQNGLYERVFQD